MPTRSRPALVELTADHQGPPNAHNDHLMRTTYRAPFESIDVRLETMDRQRIEPTTRCGC